MRHKRKATLLLFFFFAVTAVSAQQKITLSGYVKDSESGEAIIGAVVYTADKSVGVSTNEFGFYSLQVPKGKASLVCSCVGYLDLIREVEVKGATKLDFLISPDNVQLEAARVFSRTKMEVLKVPQMGAQTVDATIAKKLPALMGEADIIRVIQMLPGVQTPSEGSTGFSVRGGGVDQNLILMDGAPIYNSGHFLGFISMFNGDAVKTARLYKGDFPAKYGGKTSSVLDISTVDGNMKEFGGSASLGLISSKLFLEGPIVKDKASFMIAGRRSYADLFIPFLKNKVAQNSELRFYDLNAKVNWIINDNNRLYLSAFSSDDIFGLSLKDLGVGAMKFDYANQTQSLRWNHVFSPELFANVTAYNSVYKAAINADVQGSSFDWRSRLMETGLKASFTWYINQTNTMDFGLAAANYCLNPSETHPASSVASLVRDVVSPPTNAVSPSLYVSNESKLGDVTLRYGFRMSSFTTTGETEQLYYDPETHERTDSVHFAKGKPIQTYFGFEPRVSGSLSLTPTMSLKASYARSVQYVQQAVVSISGSVLDAWFTVSPNVKPQISDQFGLGVNKNFLDNALELTIEAFYKNNKNTIDLKDNPGVVIDNIDRESLLRVGTSYAYGTELMLKYEFPKVNGWLAYTWSQSMYNIPENNHGKPYPSPINHKHAVNAVVTYEMTKQLDLSASWVFYSGSPTTFPVARFYYDKTYIPIYSERNADHMPDFHRLDFSATWKSKKRLANRRWSGEWNVSIYNVYDRHNAWSITTGYNKVDQEIQAKKIYLFSTVPSLSYNLKF